LVVPSPETPPLVAAGRPAGILAVDEPRCRHVADALAAVARAGAAPATMTPATMTPATMTPAAMTPATVASAADPLLSEGVSMCGGPAGSFVGATVLPAAAYRPARPFSGPLFAAVEASTAANRRIAGRAAAPPYIVLVVPLGAIASSADGGAAIGRPDVITDHINPSADDGGAIGRPVVIADHINLAGRGPLTGRWPAGRPRTFPAMSHVYAPDIAAGLLAAALGRPTDGGVWGRAAPTAPCPEPSMAQPAASAAAHRPAWSEHQPAAAECEPAVARSATGPAIYSRLAVAGVAERDRPTAFEVEQARAAGLTWAADCLVAPVVIAAYYGLVVAAVGVPAHQ
jgi:hypothetical protein